MSEDYIGTRIDILLCIDPIAAWKCYNHSWMPKDRYKIGSVYPSLFFCKEGYCSWNARINSSEYLFKKAFKIVGSFVIKSVTNNNASNH
ncbi:MAG: hypothetical protein JWR05_3496 [Mucilaginibacter sp.]|nr:hypothetical protein [Mucilaginibacter sp.]